MSSNNYAPGGRSSTMTIELPQYPRSQEHQTKDNKYLGSNPVQEEISNNNSIDDYNHTQPPRSAVPVIHKWNSSKINMFRMGAVWWSFFILGANDAAYGALIPYLEEWYDVSYTVISLVFLSPIVGYTASALSNNKLHTTFGQRGVAIIMSLSHVTAYLVICLHPPYPVLVVVFILAGYGNGLGDSAWNAWVGDMANPNELLGILHAFYGLGAAIAPLIATAIITQAGWKWYTFYYFMVGAALIEVLALTSTFWKADAKAYHDDHPQMDDEELPEDELESGTVTPTENALSGGQPINIDRLSQAAQKDPPTARQRRLQSILDDLQPFALPTSKARSASSSITVHDNDTTTTTPNHPAHPTSIAATTATTPRRPQTTIPPTKPKSLTLLAIKNRVTIITALFLLIYVGVEVAIGGWIVTFMLRVRHGTPFASGLTSTGFWLGVTVGRLVLGFVTARCFKSEKHAVATYLVLCCGVQLLFWLVPQFIVSAVMVGLLGFFLAPLFPAAVVALTKLLPKRLHVAAVGFAAAFGASGACILPFMTGAIANSAGVKVLQPIILAGIIGCLCTWLCIPSLRKQSVH